MKKEENKITIKEDEKNCIECIHREVCKKYLDESKLLFTKKETFNEIGIEIGNNCPNFYYKKIYTYSLDNFKKLIKNRIENSDNAYHLLIIDSIMKLLKKNDKHIRSKNNEKKTD